jgi:hypothetical protein
MPPLKVTILIDDEVVIHGHSIEFAFKLLCSIWNFMSSTLHAFEFIMCLKCKSRGENNKRKRDTLLNSQHFEGKRGMLEL